MAPVNTALWEGHLSGKKGIGIIPIRDDSTCFFGAIDVDIYEGFDTVKFITDIHAKKLPLVPCRSKSGGLHLYMFFKEPVAAGTLRDRLATIAAYLGHAKAEVFPKQKEVIAERNDFGNWINMPYFDAEVTDRYAYGQGAERLSLEQFLDAADKVAMSATDLEGFRVELTDDLSDGPPCLQTLLSAPVRTGVRNNVMFNIAVYLYKVHGDAMGEPFEKYNAKYMAPPLNLEELANLKRSVVKKDYCYSCSREPIKGHCNMAICRQRKNGIGGMAGMPHFSGLTKFCTTPPIWFLNLADGSRMEVATSDLHRQDQFQKRCIERLNMFPPTQKTELWHAIIQRLLDNVVEIEAPKDSSPEGILYEYLEKFCTTKVQAKVEDEIMMGKPFHDTEIHSHLFRMQDFLAYLAREKFTSISPQRIALLIKEIKGDHLKRRLRGKTVNLWVIPEFQSPVHNYSVPEVKGEAVM
jgi:hypothetical protein